MKLTYAIITPARDEEDNLRRLGACLARQTILPEAWVVVENGSSDGTSEVVLEFAHRNPWTHLCTMEAVAAPQRGAPIVRAFHRGLEALGDVPDIVVNVDADISMESDYFERLLQEFERDPRLGIASGGGHEQDANGVWRLRRLAPEQAWGASRAYRRECLVDVLPLAETIGWDGIDQVKASARGWKTGAIVSIPFKHHRFEGEREGAPRKGWAAQGRASHYMGYRFSYLLLRAAHHARRDRAALALVQGYVGSALRFAPRYPDEAFRSRLRSQQRLRAVVPRLSQLLASGGPARSGKRDRVGRTR
jgi:glycosyltransferase involved in cell wall biosynthesis